MAKKKTHITYLDDAQGTIKGVHISPELWQRVQTRLITIELTLNTEDNPLTKAEPFNDLNELKKYWDFPYAYSPDIMCKNCGASTLDWENDPAHPFHLTNANFGGLIVFKCAHCQATVRKKHFKDHVAFESSPKIG